MNGYFRLIISENITGLELYPPINGGNPIEMNDLISYLQQQGIEQIDAVKLKHVIASLKDKPVVMPLMPKSIYPVSEMFKLTISDDKMQAYARFYPSSNGGNKLTKEELLKDLKYKNIVVGIKEEVIDAYFKKKTYGTDLLIAEGIKPIQGTDATIEYFFNTDLSSKPKVNEDGSVDFFNLNTINHCKKGELLARLTKEVKSVPGKNVCGEIEKGRDVKVLKLRYGRNIEISEDKCEIYSTVNGHVSLVEDSVFVSDIYEVEDVGTATGNIDSEGSVVVSGNVQSGFKIVAKGDVEVRGVVEGAEIEAGGDIVINRGMNGMGKGVLKAGGRIISKFIENSTVTSGGYIQTESILHSKVNARTEIEVAGRKGIIAGGVVRATDKITCKTLGSTMGADTAIEVGIEPEVKERFQFLQKEFSEQQKKLKETKVIIENYQKKLAAGAKMTPDQTKYIQTLVKSYKELSEEVMKMDEEYDRLEKAMHNTGHASIVVTGEVYAGTKVTISDASLVVKNSMKYCRLIKEKGEVRVTAI